MQAWHAGHTGLACWTCRLDLLDMQAWPAGHAGFSCRIDNLSEHLYVGLTGRRGTGWKCREVRNGHAGLQGSLEQAGDAHKLDRQIRHACLAGRLDNTGMIGRLDEQAGHACRLDR